MKIHLNIAWKIKCFLCIMPGFLGVLFFSIVPFFRVIFFSMIRSQFRPEFTAFYNYEKVFRNRYFRLALKNSILLILRCVPLITMISFCVAVLLFFYVKDRQWLIDIFFIPVVIPTAGIIPLWRQLFKKINSTLPVDILFMWKNTGLCIILILGALYSIPENLYDAARIDGAGNIRMHLSITLPLTAPSILFTSLYSIICTFNIFKESYLYYGSSYPPEYAYTLQYYMNNHFLKLDYQSLAVSSVYSAVISAAFIAAGFRLIKRYDT